jgi:hypothetical protein
MKNSKLIIKFIIVLLLVAQNSFATTPIPGVGVVIKKNPGAGHVTVPTGNGGDFSTQLSEGVYEISFPQDQLQTSINGIIKTNYPKSSYLFDGSGVELDIENSGIRVNLKSIGDNKYPINDQSSTFVIVVPEGGATFSGVLSWNDAVLANSVSENRGIDKADVRRMNSVKENPLYKENNKEGANPLYDNKRKESDESVKGNTIGTLHITKDEKRLKGIQKNEIDNVANDVDVKAIAETMVNRKSVNNINGGMPNRISMNITVPKQTQGATFGEKVNSGKINITLVEDGCVVLFSSKEGYRFSTSDKSITELSSNESVAFGEKVNQGLHAAGGALAQGASLLGGALPGGAVISAAVSSVGNLAGGAGGGAAAASYAATGKMTKADSGKKVWKIQDDESDAALELVDGEYELKFIVTQKATSGLKDTMKTQVLIGFSLENGVVKPKQYTGHVTLMK